MTKRLLVSSLLSLSLFATACGGGAKSETTTPTDTAVTAPADDTRSLYERLGEKAAITAVVDDFVANIAADTRINTFFANADIPALKAKLVDQICAATGGPCVYEGKDMLTTHTGMNLTEADFNAMVEDVVMSLNKFNVGQREQDELLGALGAMKGDIVGH